MTIFAKLCYPVSDGKPWPLNTLIKSLHPAVNQKWLIRTLLWGKWGHSRTNIMTSTKLRSSPVGFFLFLVSSHHSMTCCPHRSTGKPKLVVHKFIGPNFCLFPNGSLPHEARENVAEKDVKASNIDEEPVEMGRGAKADRMDVDENE